MAARILAKSPTGLDLFVVEPSAPESSSVVAHLKVRIANVHHEKNHSFVQCRGDFVAAHFRVRRGQPNCLPCQCPSVVQSDSAAADSDSDSESRG